MSTFLILLAIAFAAVALIANLMARRLDKKMESGEGYDFEEITYKRDQHVSTSRIMGAVTVLILIIYAVSLVISKPTKVILPTAIPTIVSPTPFSTVAPAATSAPILTPKPKLPAPTGEEWNMVAYDDFGAEMWMRELESQDAIGCQFLYQASCGGKKVEVFLTTAPADEDYYLNCWDITTKKPLLSLKLKIGSNFVGIPNNSRIGFGTMSNNP